MFPPMLLGANENPLDFCVASDTVRVDMRARILSRESSRVFITYENWTSNYDEWITLPSARIQPWVEPSLLAYNTLTNGDNEWGVKLASIAQWTAVYERKMQQQHTDATQQQYLTSAAKLKSN